MPSHSEVSDVVTHTLYENTGVHVCQSTGMCTQQIVFDAKSSTVTLGVTISTSSPSLDGKVEMDTSTCVSTILRTPGK